MSLASATVDTHCALTVQPGFNLVGLDPKDLAQRLTTPADMAHFDKTVADVLRSGKNFTLVLGNGFEQASVAEGLASGPCAGLASVEQLKFLQSHGLKTIVMARLHGTLVQNARALGIDVIVGGH